MRNWEGCIQARAALYLPGGRIAKELSRNPTVLVVNETAFAHGGLLPTHGKQAGAYSSTETAAGYASDGGIVVRCSQNRMDCSHMLAGPSAAAGSCAG